MQSLHFGLHGSSMGVSDCLSPKTSMWVILGRFQRIGGRYLFSARSHCLFHSIIEDSMVESQVETLAGQQISRVRQGKQNTL